MSTRKAPSKSATLFKSGTVKKGNDGKNWVIVTNKVGVKRWQKVTGASAATKPMKNKTKKSKKSKRVCLYCSENSVWGKNKPLEDFWRSLASGKKVVLIDKNGKHKIFTMPTGKITANKMYNTFDDDPNIVAVLSSNLSQDAYEVFLYPKAKDKSVEYVIKNYKKYFKLIEPMPKDLIEKGVPAQRKVLFPA
jgi:predicted molibdopterin-dependent oxidoreductase YjgC